MRDLIDFCEYLHNSNDYNVVFMEVMTIAQQLKAQRDPAIKWLRKKAKEDLPRYHFFQTPIGNKLLDRYINFFTYQIFIDPSWQELYQRSKKVDMTDLRNRQPAEIAEYAAEIAASRAGGTLNHMWQQWGDYFAAMGGNLTSKINTTSYTPQIIDQEVKDWHEELATKERGLPSEDYKVALALDSIGWKGWKWVSL